jgi:phosphatidylserine/phosphatidylglycerophosphate/cardiolipin synthase-like enzyme
LGKGNDTEILNWLRRATALLSDVGGEEVPKAKMAFSPGKDCLGLIQEAILTARNTLDVCVFTISDDRISDLLIQRHRQGIKVRVLTDNEKLLDEGSDIGKIDRAGIPVKVDRTENHMHHKFAIFDGQGVLTGSYNWTRSAEAYNQENVLLTYRPHIVAEYEACFEDLWRRMADF